MIDNPITRDFLIAVVVILAFVFVWGVNAQFTRDARLKSLWRTVCKLGVWMFRRGDPAG